MDLLISDIAGRPLLLRNVSPTGHHWLTVSLRSRRATEGAVVIARGAGRQWVRRSDPGGSFLSAGDSRVHFGLGTLSVLDSLEVRWPWGETQEVRKPRVDRVLTIRALEERGGRPGRSPVAEKQPRNRHSAAEPQPKGTDPQISPI